MILEQQLSEQIIGAMIEVHRFLGPGLLESAYCECLARELKLRRISFAREVAVPIEYKGIRLDCGYRLDFVVDDKIVLEIKSVEILWAIHEAQLLTYLKLRKLRVGLLAGFNSAVLRNALIRRVL